MDVAMAIHYYDNGVSLSDIGRKLNTSTAWVSRLLTKLCIHNPVVKSDKFWTEEEDAVVANLSLSAKEAADLLPNRTESAVKSRRTIKGLNRINNRKKWTQDEVVFIREHGHWTDYKLARYFDVGESSIKAVRRRNDVEKNGLCIECGVELGSKGKYCKDHSYISRQLSFYRNRMLRIGGDLSDEDLATLIKSNCAYCGDKGGGIDRVDSTNGYYRDNVQSCCSTCNTMKMALPLDKWLSRMAKILERYNGK